MYNLTRNVLYLKTAREMGQQDFGTPESASKDTSASAVASTGFLCLYYAKLSNANYTGAAFWRDSALTVLSCTTDWYFQRSGVRNRTPFSPMTRRIIRAARRLVFCQGGLNLV
ncbi:hypothetical protein PIIN_06822 [Serendipita indica DSM 11827]|uniref:Uncharacterized protein n=1 Tax=Serendipita indica (strain DSM 11827) TaxID=1109443 RepID=G4TNJ8_SERID|nr:hypothetical protein PIIN_06822 [Serendipita indica DSM 11827]